jgi:ferredoxin--NADP+ reductase
MSPEEIAELRRSKYNAAVARLVKPNSDLMLIRVKPDRPLQPHKAGQYTALGLGFWEPRVPGCQDEALLPDDESKLARRSYSISCPILDDNLRNLIPGQIEWLEFYIVLVRDTGSPKAPALTPRLFMLREGDRLFMGEKITGYFTLDPVQPDDTVLFLGTGTGEAPHNYMTWDLLRRGHRGKIINACCVRYQRDLGYTPTHEALMRRFPNYLYLPLTTREPHNIGHKVYIQDLLTSGDLEKILTYPLDPAKTHVFLCGNPKMIGVPEKERDSGARVYPKPEGVCEILERRGFTLDQPNIKLKGNVHFEEYW